MVNVINANKEIFRSIRKSAFLQCHLNIYSLISPFCRGLHVLDVGCGFGWGTNILTENASHVIGIDPDQFRISFAKEHFETDILSFECTSLMDFYPVKIINVVTAIQVIQYQEQPSKFYEKISDLLMDDGKLILVTKVAGIFSDINEDAIMKMLLSYGEKSLLKLQKWQTINNTIDHSDAYSNTLQFFLGIWSKNN